MFCGNCGSKIDGKKFCTQCGTPVPQIESEDGRAEEAQEQPAAAVEAPAAETFSPAPAADSPEGNALEKEKPAEPAVKDAAVTASVDGAAATQALNTLTEEPAAPAQATVPMAAAPTQVAPAPQDTARMYVADAVQSQATAAQPQQSAAQPDAKKKGKTGIKIAAIAGSVVAVAAVVVAALFVTGILPPSTPIDEENFPNAVIRQALLDQVDDDGNGRLSSEEASSITALVYTNGGARFLRDGVQVNVDEVRESLAAQAEADPAAAQMGAMETTMPDLSVFPAMKTVVVRDTNIAQIDTTQVPEAEYVDVRGNQITQLDLSSNGNLTTLFCDPDVQLTGLEEAGLYYTDLITGIERSGKNNNLSIEYDTQGRPTKITEYGTAKTLEYDDQSRLVKVAYGQNDQATTYQYAANGLLAAYSYVPSTDVSETVVTTNFGYDAEGNLTQISDGNSGESAQSLIYEDGRLVADKEISTYSYNNQTEQSFTQFKYDDSGRMVNAFGNTMPDMTVQRDTIPHFEQAATQLAYNDQGQVTALIYEGSLTSSATSSYKTEFAMTPEGFPQKTTVTMQGSGSNSQSFAQTYTCNADGYITSIQAEGSYSTGMKPSQVSYVKRVGALEDRPSQRFVPVMRIGIVPLAVGTAYGPVEALESTDCIRGDWWPYDELLQEPQCALLAQMGITPDYLTNPNEMSLAAYDREHWKDGLDLSVGELPIQSESVQSKIAMANSAEMPANPESFLNDPVYGSLVGEYMALARYLGDMSDSARRNALNNGNVDSLLSKYPTVSRELLQIRGFGNNAESFNFAFSYVDLNEDGTNELVVTTVSGSYPTMIGACYVNDNGKPKLVAESAYRDWYALSTSNCLVESGSGGFDTVMRVAYKLEGTELKKVGECSYTYTSSENRGTDNDPYELTFQIDGGKVQKLTVPLSQIENYTKQFEAAYPDGICQWTCLW